MTYKNQIKEGRDFRTILSEIATVIEKRLARFFNEIKENTSEQSFEIPIAFVLSDHVSELTLRQAKRLRAAFVWAGAALFDPRAVERSAVIDVAAAIELMQTYLLIHDDIMDESPTRRGGPSVHKALEAFVGDKKLGESLAILTGDLASAYTQLLLSDLDVDDLSNRKIQQLFTSIHMNVIYGQTLDMASDAPAYETALYKTASYTTIGPITLGAALSGAREQDINYLSKAASSLGVAFQFRDDLISTFGDPLITGKSTDSDLLEGKKTVLIEEARSRADKLQLKKINAVFGAGTANPNAVAAAREALIQCGAKDACETHIRELTEEFVSALERNYVGIEAKDFLIDIARHMSERNT